MSTVRDLISGSMRLLGLLAQGETASASESSEALSSLNSMVESWSIEGLTVFSQTREAFPLVGGQATYTMGPNTAAILDPPNVDFDTTRPFRIENAALQYTDGTTFEVPIEIISPDQWAEITQKTMSGDPRALYASGTFPNETINLFPVPQSALNLVLYTFKPFTSFASLNTVISLPPGYERALRYNLAIEIAPEYGKDPSGIVATRAMEAKANINRINMRPEFLECDVALTSGSRFNIYSGRSR